MDSLQVLLVTFFIWFFAWHSLLSVMKTKQLERSSWYIVGLIGSVIVYDYLSKEQSDDNV